MKTVFDLREISVKIQYLDQLIASSNFWKNPASTYQTLQRIQIFISKRQKQYQRWHSLLDDIEATLELLELSDDEQLLQEAHTNLTQLQQELETAEIRQLQYTPYNKNAAYLTITAESGSADAQDWVHIILRMYYLWAVSHLYKISLVEISDKDETAIKYALEIKGCNAYGYLKLEEGIHVRIVRTSALNGSGKRHTCFTKVEVSPILDDSVTFEIPPKDLEIIVSCHRGNVNRPETWVRMIHIPTGTAVFCDQERNQLQNKQKALIILKNRLLAIALAQGVNQISAIQPQRVKSLSNKIIREYILHPYTKVKDLRTHAQTTAVAEVLDGDIDFLYNLHR